MPPDSTARLITTARLVPTARNDSHAPADPADPCQAEAPPEAADVMSLPGASELLGVGEDQLRTMVDGCMLDDVGWGPVMRFRRVEVQPMAGLAG